MRFSFRGATDYVLYAPYDPHDWRHGNSPLQAPAGIQLDTGANAKHNKEPQLRPGISAGLSCGLITALPAQVPSRSGESRCMPAQLKSSNAGKAHRILHGLQDSSGMTNHEADVVRCYAQACQPAYTHVCTPF